MFYYKIKMVKVYLGIIDHPYHNHIVMANTVTQVKRYMVDTLLLLCFFNINM